MKTTVTEFKGKPVFGIVQDDGRIVVSFGVKKAEAILQFENEIADFVAQVKAGVLKVPKGITATEDKVVIA
mgnify:CR=1 FL=1